MAIIKKTHTIKCGLQYEANDILIHGDQTDTLFLNAAS